MQPSSRRPDAAAPAVAGVALAWAAAAWAALVWAGAPAALVAAGRAPRLPAGAEVAAAAVRLPAHPGDPAAAWPEPWRSRLPGPLPYWAAQAAAAVALGAAGTAAAGAGRRRRGGGALGVPREAGFARRRDLGRLAVRAPVPGRLTLGRAAGRLLAAEPQASLAVVGPTGCGKTAGFVIPALLEWCGPVLATSVKGDLLAATAAHRRRRGRVWVYDPTGSAGEACCRWSPLAACATWDGAVRAAAWMTEAAQARLDTLADADYWYAQARKGLAPYLHAAAASGRGLAELVRWVDEQETAEVEAALRAVAEAACGAAGAYEALWAEAARAMAAELGRGGRAPAFAHRPPEAWPTWVRERLAALVERRWREELAAAGAPPGALAPLVAARALWAKEPRLRGSVFATMENVLAGWADPGVLAAAEGAELDLGAWLAGDNTIYVVATAHEQARLRPVLATLVQLAVRAAYDAAAAAGGRLAHPALVLLDEAGNIAPLRDLPAYASTARSHGITLVTVFQDLAQVRAIYRDRAQTVLNNHRARLFGTGIADRETLEYVSGLVGDERRTELNTSADVGGGRRTVSEYRTYRRAAPVDVLRRVRPGDAVLLYGSELPVHLRLRPWFADRRLRAAAGGGRGRAPGRTRRWTGSARLRR